MVVVTGLPSVEASIAEATATRFAELVEPYLPKMLHIAERLAGPDNRDDVVQEALIKVDRHGKLVATEHLDHLLVLHDLLAVGQGEAERGVVTDQALALRGAERRAAG